MEMAAFMGFDLKDSCAAGIESNCASHLIQLRGAESTPKSEFLDPGHSNSASF